MARARALGLPVGRPRDLHTPAIRNGLSALKRMGMPMSLPKDAPRNRIREAQRARENRLEIVRALSTGQVTRRELFKWRLFTSSGLLAWKNGLNVYARLWPGPDRHSAQPAV
jgi:hypothetical protein